MRTATRLPATMLAPVAWMIFSTTACNSNAGASHTEKESAGAASGSVHAPTQFADIKGRKIAYRTVGSGEPIVLCQRFRGNLDNWDPAFLDALAENYRVITFDFSGFGLSTGTPGSTMMDFASDVKDLCDYLQLEKIIVGGWSFGGAVAQVVTAEFSSLVEQTILIGTRPPGKIAHPMEQIFLERSAKPYNDLDDEIILFFEPSSEVSRQAAKASHERIAGRKIDRDMDIRQDLWSNYRQGFADYEKDPGGVLQKLMTTTTPILVISADHEVVFPPQNWFDLNRKLPTMQLVVIPQTGHGPHHQYPVMVAEYIHSFIRNNQNYFFKQ